MKTFLTLKNEHTRQLPEEFRNEDVRYTEELVEIFLREFTSRGDTIFDPFTGFGTTLLVAEKMERVGYGVEFDEKRWRYVQSILRNPERVLNGDSTKLNSLSIPNFDFSMTSPPYMGKHHKENPFTAYSTEGNGYDAYLETLKSVYRQISEKLKPSGYIVIEVSNLKHEDAPLTALAWDVASAVSEVLHFEGEIIANWINGSSYGYNHSYCLVFRNG